MAETRETKKKSKYRLCVRIHQAPQGGLTPLGAIRIYDGPWMKPISFLGAVPDMGKAVLVAWNPTLIMGEVAVPEDGTLKALYRIGVGDDQVIVFVTYRDGGDGATAAIVPHAQAVNLYCNEEELPIRANLLFRPRVPAGVDLEKVASTLTRQVKQLLGVA